MTKHLSKLQFVIIDTTVLRESWELLLKTAFPSPPLPPCEVYYTDKPEGVQEAAITFGISLKVRVEQLPVIYCIHGGTVHHECITEAGAAVQFMRRHLTQA